jgi:hemerythrin-like domain-containing protein
MTLRQSIQAAPTKTAELIAKLSATSNQAVKTREGLFAQLSNELARYVEVEEQHLLPLLRKHPQTKELAGAALKGNKDLRASLEKLSALPKDNDEFLAELAKLNKGFQQHVRDERKELLPAVLEALSDEEAGALAANIEGAVADAEKVARDEKREEAAQAKRQADEAKQAAADAAKAKRDEKRKEAAQAKRQADEVKQAAGAKRAAVRARKAADLSAREATAKVAETIKRGTASMQDGAHEVSETITERTQQVASQAREAMTVYGDFARKVVEDLRAVRASSSVSVKAMSDVRSAWMDWLGKAARTNIDASQQLLQCRSVTQVAELQRALVTNAMRNWMEGSTKVLEITQRGSK